jgi:hypothetical protein
MYEIREKKYVHYFQRKFSRNMKIFPFFLIFSREYCGKVSMYMYMLHVVHGVQWVWAMNNKMLKKG